MPSASEANPFRDATLLKGVTLFGCHKQPSDATLSHWMSPSWDAICPRCHTLQSCHPLWMPPTALGCHTHDTLIQRAPSPCGVCPSVQRDALCRHWEQLWGPPLPGEGRSRVPQVSVRKHHTSFQAAPGRAPAASSRSQREAKCLQISLTSRPHEGLECPTGARRVPSPSRAPPLLPGWQRCSPVPQWGTGTAAGPAQPWQ